MPTNGTKSDSCAVNHQPDWSRIASQRHARILTVDLVVHLNPAAIDAKFHGCSLIDTRGRFTLSAATHVWRTSVRSAMQQQHPESAQGNHEVRHPRQNGRPRVEPLEGVAGFAHAPGGRIFLANHALTEASAFGSSVSGSRRRGPGLVAVR